MPVTGFDHAALPTADSERFLAFYKALGFGIEGEDAWRAGTMPIFSITFGDNKINVHTEELFARAKEIPGFLRGPTAEPGCGDFCFVWEGGIDALLELLAGAGRRRDRRPRAPHRRAGCGHRSGHQRLHA